MASINSYGGIEHRGDGGRWTQPAPKPGSSGVGGRPLSQLGSVTLSSYKGGEGVNVDRPAEDDSDSSDRGENGFASPQQRSAAQRTKDKAQQQQQLQTTSTSMKGAAKAVAAKGKQRKLREKRRGTGVVHLPVSDQSTGDSLDDDDDDADDSTKHNTSSNEGSGGLLVQAPSAATQARGADSAVTVAASSLVAEQPSKFGPRAMASTVYTRSWQSEPSATSAAAAEASGTWGAGSTRLHSESPGREESPTAPALRSCLKGVGGAPSKDAPTRRPVTSLVNQFELTRPQAFSNGGGSVGGSSNSSSSSAAPIPSSTTSGPARGSREDGGPAYMSQLRGQKEEDVGRGGGSAPFPAPAPSAVPRYPGDGAGYTSSSSWSGPNLPAQGSSGLAARAAVSGSAVLPAPQPTRAPVLPPWKQPAQADSSATTSVGGASGSSVMFHSSTTVVSQQTSAQAVSFGRASLTSIDDGSLSANLAPPSRPTNEPGKRADSNGGGPGSAAVDELQRKIAELQKTIEKLQAANSQYHKVLTEREREVEKLERDLQAKNAHIVELEHDLEELDHDNISLAEENEALRNAVATLSKQ